MDGRRLGDVTMIESSDLRLTKMPLNDGSGYMPALGFGTLIHDPA
jgi:alcohol dehydrogenase (NADP+)